MGQWKHIIGKYWIKKNSVKHSCYGNTQTHAKEGMAWLSKAL